MEKLAEGLERLGEDDLLHVVQLVHDNKTEETYTKNDVESKSHCSAVLSSRRY
jgi:transcription initiation factor IIF auxiliary subunit